MAQVDSPNPKTVHLVSLGCPKTLVDSEFLLGMLAEEGLEYVTEPEKAGIIIVNTCSFIQPAVEEAVDVILSLAVYKQQKTAHTLAVIGCLPERYGAELKEAMPEVDIFWGTGRLDMLPGILLGREPLPEPADFPPPGFATTKPGPRLRSAPFHTAYLKIAEGCSNACSYCMIPQLRGRLQSRPLATLLEEAAALAQSGARELILVAQDTTAYGRDLKDGTNLARLLTGLAGIKGLDWLRVMYAYPGGLSDELLDVMAGEAKVCPYLDIPLQHASPPVLKRMGRSGRLNLLNLVQRLRKTVPGITLRTTFMVGFPGETDEDFDLLMDFTREACFERMGVFKFSPEEGVRAAGMSDQVPQRIKENRRRKLMALQRKISRQANRSLVGHTLPTLVEGASPETDLLLTGRTMGMAPEIDGRVLINKGTASPGRILPVLITEAHDYDIVGEISEDGTTD